MFSISNNPQASKAEVLVKAEKYINGEEALISKKESSSTHKEKSGTDKRRGRSPKRQSVRERSPKKDEERSPKRRGNLRDRLGPPQLERRRRYSPQQLMSLKVIHFQSIFLIYFYLKRLIYVQKYGITNQTVMQRVIQEEEEFLQKKGQQVDEHH